jgi:hypothetical protein
VGTNHALLRSPASAARRLLAAIVAVLAACMVCAVALGQGVASEPADAGHVYSQEELDRLLAPIALYPDDLLAQILMAATYPLEVVEADRWARANPGLSGDRLDEALQEQDWDPSVKGLVSVPQVLAMMDERLDWTEMLGDAFLMQQQDVMDTVQRLRERAEAEGTLASTPQQSVTTSDGIVNIAPVNPEVVYVPVYDPALVYGTWWWPAAPYYWYPPGYVVGSPGLYFGVGFVVGAAIWGRCDWHHRTVVINTRNYDRYNRARIANDRWTHDPQHRRGVPYPNEATRRRYAPVPAGANARREYRGYAQPFAAPRASPAPPPPQRAPERRAPSIAAQPQRAAPEPQRGTERRPPLTAAQPQRVAPAPASAPAAPAFESFGRGAEARVYQERGAASRASERSTRSAPPAGAHPQGGQTRGAPSHPSGTQGGGAHGAPSQTGGAHGGGAPGGGTQQR